MNQEQETAPIIFPGNPAKENLVPLLESYRKLKKENAIIQDKMDEYKRQILSLVEVIGGEFKDDQGSARMMTRKASVAYKSADVDKLVQSWLKSRESLIRTCGEMLEVHRSERKETTYLQIK